MLKVAKGPMGYEKLTHWIDITKFIESKQGPSEAD